MSSGVGPFHDFVDDFSFLEEEETVNLFAASGVPFLGTGFGGW